MCQGDERALAITPSKGVYFCHMGQVGGDCIALVGHILGLGMKDAAEWLQETLPQQQAPRAAPSKPKDVRQAEFPFDPNAFAAKLTYGPEVKALGLSEETAKLYRIGMHRGRLYIPLCPSDVDPPAYVQQDEQGALKLPDKWLTPRNVVQFKRGA